MTTLFPPFSILFIWLIIFHLADCHYDSIGHLCTGNPEGNNGFDYAIVSFLDQLTMDGSTTGFKRQSLTSIAGGSTIYGLAQCRGNAINTYKCTKCLRQAKTELFANCKNHSHGAIWFDLCFIRFDVNNFFGSWTIDSGLVYKKNLKNAEKPRPFSRAVQALLTQLNYSSTESVVKIFSKKTVTYISGLEGVIIYGMAQCTQDLTLSDCNACITNLSSQLESLCGTSVGCALYHTSCFFRYETYNFFH